MNYKIYEVIVWENGTEKWYFNNQLHRENGPAIIYPDGHKIYYLNGVSYYKEQWEAKLNEATHQDKIVEIEGKKYQLKEM